jgi:hypothetical protein
VRRESPALIRSFDRDFSPAHRPIDPPVKNFSTAPHSPLRTDPSSRRAALCETETGSTIATRLRKH